MSKMAFYKHIQFKHISNELLLPNTLLSYINKYYINYPNNIRNPNYSKYNNLTPIMYKFNSLGNLLTTLDNKDTTNKQISNITNTITLINQFDHRNITNQIYYRNISTIPDTMIIGRIWFNYNQGYCHLEFISIYEQTNNIDNPECRKNMMKYWSVINNNKVYPDFNSNMDMDKNKQLFLKHLQELY